MGECFFGIDRECTYKRLFPTVVEVVGAEKTSSLQHYIDALRVKVCENCKQESPYEKCQLREDLECAVDQDLPSIIEMIETVQHHIDKEIDS